MCPTKNLGGVQRRMKSRYIPTITASGNLARNALQISAGHHPLTLERFCLKNDKYLPMELRALKASAFICSTWVHVLGTRVVQVLQQTSFVRFIMTQARFKKNY